MGFYDFEKNIFYKPNKSELKKVEEFLKAQGLELDKNIDYTVTLENDGQIIGTGSFGGDVIKCMAIDEKFRGYGISNIIASELINEEYRIGNSKLFVFTKPDNENLFNQLGFYTLERAEKAIILENDKHGIERYCNKLINESLYKDINSKNYKNIASIVMNCNPFTLGHKYLIEKASNENDLVHLFILDEDKSIFPAKVRYDLVEKGIGRLNNVILHKAKDYIISSATFPTYFLKNENDILKSQAQLDAKIFVKYIAKSLNINKRYVGTEPICKVTSEYNKVLKEILPENDIELIEVERKTFNNEIISASKVREFIKEDKFDELRNFIPQSTYDFLNSEDGIEIVDKIKKI